MSDAELVAVLREIVIKNSPFHPDGVLPGQTLARNLGFDSLAMLLTLTDIEDRLGVEIPVERLDEMKDITFDELVQLVEQERERAGGGPPSGSPEDA